MTRINEWDKVWSVAEGGSPPSKKLIDRICGSLARLAPAPQAVHFFRGEGLRWIRVGFDEDRILPPAAVGQVGGSIDGCLEGEALYFHALRPHDLLFFLEDPEAGKDAVGMPPRAFGLPLGDVLDAWR